MKFVERATRVLNERKIIAEISKLAHDKIGSEISICFPKCSTERDKIYFIIDTPNDDTVDLSIAILRILDFDYEDADEKGDVIILNRQFHSQQAIAADIEEENVTLFTTENYDNIHAFFKKHYHHDAQKDTGDIAHQDKRQRSVSPLRGSSFFTQNEDQQGLGEEPITSEIIVEYLKKAPWWNDLRAAPSDKARIVLEQGFELAKRALTVEPIVSPKPVSQQQSFSSSISQQIEKFLAPENRKAATAALQDLPPTVLSTIFAAFNARKRQQTYVKVSDSKHHRAGELSIAQPSTPGSSIK